MPANVDIREGVAEAFDALREEFADGIAVTLLKASGTYDEFDTVLELTDKWFFEYSDYRKSFLLQIAADTTALTSAMAAATHVNVDGTVYIIDRADTTAPKSTDVTWKIACNLRDTAEHYEPV